MTSKPSRGFILWAVPRFHRPVQAVQSHSVPAPSVKTQFVAARPIERRAAPASEKTTAGPDETAGYLYTYH
ncbi:hypothetical protein [Acidocella sp.]|uniref:hypothetical protein n=1 Tax=Acidocella sp. TaxID=50710 RepID=UPI002606453C|nr:hypothetical protein [Acidocella sp.]MDD2794445.1 hypothetical protein [Acidocella sp.]